MVSSRISQASSKDFVRVNNCARTAQESGHADKTEHGKAKEAYRVRHQRPSSARAKTYDVLPADYAKTRCLMMPITDVNRRSGVAASSSDGPLDHIQHAFLAKKLRRARRNFSTRMHIVLMPQSCCQLLLTLVNGARLGGTGAVFIPPLGVVLINKWQAMELATSLLPEISGIYRLEVSRRSTNFSTRRRHASRNRRRHASRSRRRNVVLVCSLL